MWVHATFCPHQSVAPQGNHPRPPGNHLKESQSAPPLHVTSCPTRPLRSPHPDLPRPPSDSSNPTARIRPAPPACPAPAYKYAPRVAYTPRVTVAPLRSSPVAGLKCALRISTSGSAWSGGSGRFEKGKKRISRQRGDDSTREARKREKKREDKARRQGGHRALPDPPFSRVDPARPREDAASSRFIPAPGSQLLQIQLPRSDSLAPGHMTPTVLMEFGQQRPIKRGYEEMAIRGVAEAAPRGYAETVGESEGAAGSPVCVDSEDSSAPKRKCISLNSDGFDVKREIFVPSKMSSSERRYLRKRFRAELDSVRDLLKKPKFAASVPVNRAPALSSSAAPRPKKVQRGSHAVRGAKGRFLPTKPRPEPSAVLSEAAVFKQCDAILKKLMTHKYSHIFNVPVDVVKLQIPDYFDIIKHPMDLGTVKKKLDSGSYTSPSDFAADVRLTFNNAMTYNPRGHAVHDMAILLNKMFENRWRTIEKKLASVATETHVEVDRADSKRRKTPPVDCSEVSMECVRQAECVKPKMTYDEKEAFGNCLSSLSEDQDLPAHIIDLLQQCIDNNTDQLGDGEIEIDIHAVSDDLLFELKKHVDKYLQDRGQNQQAKSEPSENEAVNVSGLSHSSTNPCKGGEPVEEDVDICGNASPILIEKDAQIRSSKGGSPSSSSSDSEASSSDSDSGSDSESESEKVVSPAKVAKGTKKPDQLVEQDKSDVISPADANCPADNVGLREEDSESKPAPEEGDNSKSDRQVSPDKLLRAALLRSRYADVIVKARGVLSQGGDKQDELEKLQKEEKARLLAEGNAAMEARRAEAEAEAKRKRDLEREKARQALQEMERTVEINDNLHLKDLEMLGTATAEHIVSSVDETSPERSQDGMPSFLPGFVNPLEQLGLFMKTDDEEDEEPSSVPSDKDAEEGEIN
ncbi:transcription factor GTE9-like [Phragmites australis]|uniref:transcription factor GTE9-like n=1 Tax=Phragmites australis TaxID=29695 RepID=UPI002D79D7A2|nr:transcription factor GTE9-like [Phragmites australis]